MYWIRIIMIINSHEKSISKIGIYCDVYDRRVHSDFRGIQQPLLPDCDSARHALPIADIFCREQV